MKKIIFFLSCILICALYSCSDNYVSESNVMNELKLINEDNNIQDVNLYSCLQETEIDSFLFYMNEFNNYLLEDSTQDLFVNSNTIIKLYESYTFENFDNYFTFIQDGIGIPIEITRGYFKYSKIVLPYLDIQSDGYEIIGRRYYDLVRTNCLESNLPNHIFDNDLPEMYHKGCGFWDIFAGVAGAAASVAGAATIEVLTIGAGTIAAVGILASGYGAISSVIDCL